MKKRKINRKGMTLIEVLFSTAIFSFVAITLFALFKLGQTYWAKGIAYNTLQAEGKRILTLLQQDIKESDISKDKSYSCPMLVSNILVGTQNVRRDGLLLVIPNPNYKGDTNTHPLIYRAYVSTKEQNNNQGGVGEIYLLEYRPSSSTGYDATWNNIDSNLSGLFGDGFSKDDLNNLNPNPIKVSLLSNNLFSFQSEIINNNSISISIVLMRKSFSDQKLQNVRFDLEIAPANNNQFPFTN
jgi:prepilin-type N-terminal cleavage/methylation domain-containing protein